MILYMMVGFVLKNKFIFLEKIVSEKTEVAFFSRSVLGLSRALLFFSRPKSSNTCKTMEGLRKKVISSEKYFLFDLKMTSIDCLDHNLSIDVICFNIDNDLQCMLVDFLLLELGSLS